MSVVAREITVRFDVIGFHRWPEAAEVLPARAYLSDRHRHRFFFEVTVHTGHNDREVEFHELLDLCRGEFADARSREYGRRSCEDLAEAVWQVVSWKYPGRAGRVAVWEDNEVGAALTFDAR